MKAMMSNMTMAVAMVVVTITEQKLKSNTSMMTSQNGITGIPGVQDKMNGKFHGLVGINKAATSMICISKTSNVTPKVKFGVTEVMMLVLSTFLVNVIGIILDSLSTSNTMELTL